LSEVVHRQFCLIVILIIDLFVGEKEKRKGEKAEKES